MRIAYELTEEEASVAAARAAWRMSLSDGLLARHLAPLAAFALVVLFVAVLGWTGLMSRRAAEIGLILAAAAYMIYRLWTRRRFLSARRAAEAWAKATRAAGAAFLTLDDTGLRWQAGGLDRAWLFADGLDIEEASGLVYVWPRRGEPLVWPSRVEDAPELLALARARAGLSAPPAFVDDDDD